MSIWQKKQFSSQSGRRFPWRLFWLALTLCALLFGLAMLAKADSLHSISQSFDSTASISHQADVYNRHLAQNANAESWRSAGNFFKWCAIIGLIIVIGGALLDRPPHWFVTVLTIIVGVVSAFCYYMGS